MGLQCEEGSLQTVKGFMLGSLTRGGVDDKKKRRDLNRKVDGGSKDAWPGETCEAMGKGGSAGWTPEFAQSWGEGSHARGDSPQTLNPSARPDLELH